MQCGCVRRGNRVSRDGKRWRVKEPEDGGMRAADLVRNLSKKAFSWCLGRWGAISLLALASLGNTWRLVSRLAFTISFQARLSSSVLISGKANIWLQMST